MTQIHSFVCRILINYKNYRVVFFLLFTIFVTFVLNNCLGTSIFNTKIKVSLEFDQIHFKVLPEEICKNHCINFLSTLDVIENSAT